MLAELSRERVEAFQRDGTICLRGVIDSEWIEPLRETVEEARESPGEYTDVIVDEPDGRHYHSELRRWPEFETYRRFIFDSPAASIAGTLMEWNEVSLLWDTVLYRTAGVAVKTPWHHDTPYHCVDGVDAECSVWIPLYPVGRESSLEFVRGSHRWGKNFFRPNFDPKFKAQVQGDDESLWDELPDIDAKRSDFDIVGHALEPGDCLVFHGLTLHGSAGNLDAEKPLVALSIRFAGERAVYRPDKPGGMYYDWSHLAAASNLRPGDPVSSDMFPRVWSCDSD